ncbi:AMP-binding protein [Spirochaeta isovalerica]|uniref:Long-chain acyl-CoA synthetase n=1 Tax=Spirochaeta isovalerica TaxID=150 RepID=A0A841R9P2_9SPIO|nr:AMP-binding protein [Spirochaeta isovalerica]MBB6480486.1 long-chain acyl-CoA synthetase [Spirochaeta isovalerica]
MNMTFSQLVENHNVSDKAKAFGFLGKDFLTYGDVKSLIKSLKNELIYRGIEKGDRIALFSENQPHWGVVYLAVTSLGAVIVPILPEFASKAVVNILDHSGAKLLFASEKQRRKLEEAGLSLPVFKLEDLEPVDGNKADKTLYEKDFALEEDDLAAILYTSGTTGNSKGVMLSHRNILSNVEASYQIIAISEEDRFLSLLPLAHTYECTLGLLFPFTNGSSVTYIEGVPSPRILMDALARVKPTMILSVPLLIEKIYRSKVAGLFHSRKITSILYSLPPTRFLLNHIAGKKLLKAFGGELRFFGIGGAPLGPDVERFLKDSRFPYSIGYGLTETSPLLAGDNPSIQRFRSTGNPVFNGELRIGEPDRRTGVGEIQAKGPNIMLGYYKDEERTAEVFTEDGWFRTGDLGKMTQDGRLFIKGRKKNLILGSNGENIYPEEIESLINENEYVEESVITQKGKELVAFIYLNAEKLTADLKNMKLPTEKFEEYKASLLDRIRQEVNKHLNAGIRLSSLIEQKIPFEKTPSMKIKRYLYI